MPTWNAEAFLQETLDSLAAQTYPNLQILISDDASDDGTPGICERFAAAHSNVRVVRQPKRLGWIGNANYLLNAADGDYVFFAFHDDPLLPTYVAQLAAALDSHPSAVLAFSDVFWKNGVDSYPELDGVSSRVERGRRIVRKRGSWWIPNRGLFRAEASKRIGGMRRHFAGEYKADWPWLLHLALLGGFVRVPEPLIRKAWRKGSVAETWGRRLTLWKSTAVLLACARELRRAPLPLVEELRLQTELGRFWLRSVAKGRRW